MPLVVKPEDYATPNSELFILIVDKNEPGYQFTVSLTTFAEAKETFNSYVRLKREGGDESSIRDIYLYKVFLNNPSDPDNRQTSMKLLFSYSLIAQMWDKDLVTLHVGRHAYKVQPLSADPPAGITYQTAQGTTIIGTTQYVTAFDFQPANTITINIQQPAVATATLPPANVVTNFAPLNVVEQQMFDDMFGADPAGADPEFNSFFVDSPLENGYILPVFLEDIAITEWLPTLFQTPMPTMIQQGQDALITAQVNILSDIGLKINDLKNADPAVDWSAVLENWLAAYLTVGMITFADAAENDDDPWVKFELHSLRLLDSPHLPSEASLCDVYDFYTPSWYYHIIKDMPIAIRKKMYDLWDTSTSFHQPPPGENIAGINVPSYNYDWMGGPLQNICLPHEYTAVVSQNCLCSSYGDDEWDLAFIDPALQVVSSFHGLDPHQLMERINSFIDEITAMEDE